MPSISLSLSVWVQLKGCERLEPFSVITYHLSLFFFSPFSLAAFSERMGTLEGEPSSDLNIDKSWCLILVLIYKATQGRLVDWMASADCSTHAELHFFFFQRSTPANTFQRGKKMCQLSCLFLKHSVKDGFVHSLGWSCSKACFYGHGHSE